MLTKKKKTSVRRALSHINIFILLFGKVTAWNKKEFRSGQRKSSKRMKWNRREEGGIFFLSLGRYGEGGGKEKKKLINVSTACVRVCVCLKMWEKGRRVLSQKKNRKIPFLSLLFLSLSLFEMRPSFSSFRKKNSLRKTVFSVSGMHGWQTFAVLFFLESRLSVSSGSSRRCARKTQRNSFFCFLSRHQNWIQRS